MSHGDGSVYLELLAPDPSTGVRKTPLTGLHYHLGADELPGPQSH